MSQADTMEAQQRFHRSVGDFLDAIETFFTTQPFDANWVNAAREASQRFDEVQSNYDAVTQLSQEGGSFETQPPQQRQPSAAHHERSTQSSRTVRRGAQPEPEPEPAAKPGTAAPRGRRGAR
jgi:hypothetical protein